MADEWYLYIVQNKLGHLYTGITTDVKRRVEQHSSGKGAKALKGKGPITLLWSQGIGSRSLATKAELWVKACQRKQKFALIEGLITLPEQLTDKENKTDES